MLSIEEVNCLGNILNSTFGKSSTPNTPTSSTVGVLSGNSVVVTYTTILHLPENYHYHDKNFLESEKEIAHKVCKDYISNIKSSFKKENNRNLSLKELSSDDSLELITVSPFSPIKKAYFRLKKVLEIK